MEIFHIRHPHQMSNLKPSSVAFGNFDGLHQGHQQVIKEALNKAKEHKIQAGVMTFYPHPKEVLGQFENVTYLTPLPEKLELLAKMGLDFVIVVEFTPEFASLTPLQFIEQYIIGLQIKKVITGFDFCFGHRGQGTIETLHEWSQITNDFEHAMVPSVDKYEQKISSSRIRNLLKEGQLHMASHLLNRPYELKGKVIHGEKRGRQLGFPTANIEPSHSYVIPKHGVYAVWAFLGNRRVRGVLNIGTKPTFHQNNERYSLEVHLLDFNEQIYDEMVMVQFVHYLRSEQKFDSIDHLKSQIEVDIQLALTKFST
jgi:riboflavin kinase/FMN adenylyltransferase